jgi:flagellar hook-associated protein 3 FlgL
MEGNCEVYHARTQRMMTENAVRHMDENNRSSGSPEKVASGSSTSASPDNPSLAATSWRCAPAWANQAYLDTTQVTEDWMAVTCFSLNQMVELGKRAAQLTAAASRGLREGTARRAWAEVDMLLQQAVEIANTSHQDSFIFAGYNTTTLPFTALDGNGDTLTDSVQYNNPNTNEVILRSVGPGLTIPQNIEGEPVFSPLFDALIRARDFLNGDDTANIQVALGDLETALAGVSNAATVNGARQRQVRQMGERLEKAQIELKSLLSLKEDANMAEAIANLRQQETVYQSVLEVGQRAISALSLFDMLS